eukprot:18159-Heterococcus_DN1.PRE.3
MLAAQFNVDARDGRKHKQQASDVSSGCLLTPILAAIDRHYPVLTSSAADSSRCGSATAVVEAAAPPLWRASTSKPAEVPKKKKWRRMPLPPAAEGSEKEQAEASSAMVQEEPASWQCETAAAVVAQQTTVDRLPWINEQAEVQPANLSTEAAAGAADISSVKSNASEAAEQPADVTLSTAAAKAVDRSMAVSPTSTACDAAAASDYDMMQCDDADSTVQRCNARSFWPDSNASSGASAVGSQHSYQSSSSSSSSGDSCVKQNMAVVQVQSSSSTLPAYAAQYNDYLNQLMKFKLEGHFDERFRQRETAAIAQRWALDAAVSLQLKLPVLQCWCTAGHISEDVRQSLAEQAWAVHIDTATVELKRKRL